MRELGLNCTCGRARPVTNCTARVPSRPGPQKRASIAHLGGAHGSRIASGGTRVRLLSFQAAVEIYCSWLLPMACGLFRFSDYVAITAITRLPNHLIS
jgi:hypothetical protein